MITATTSPSTTGSTARQDIESLRTSIRGTVLVPGSPGWDHARSAFNLDVDQNPALLALPADPDDVVTIVRFAADHHIQVVPQRTGHNASPLGSLAGALLLRTDGLTTVHLDAERRGAVVGAGAKWADVVPLASEHGLAALHGSTPDVSVVGYSLGGGLGWYARAHGLAANSVVAIELVTPDGNRRWVSHSHEPDLFWALRGGGGSFGVVTAMEIKLYPIEEVYAGALFFPIERSAEILKAWLDWTRTAPETVTSVGRMLRFPPTEDVPASLRGGAYTVIEAVFLDDEVTSSRLLESLRRLGPTMDTFVRQPPAGIAELHMDPQQPLPYDTDHLVLGDVTDQAVDSLVAAVGPGSGSELISVEIRHLGGALSRDGGDHGALGRMPGEYLLFGVGATPGPAARRTVHRNLDEMVSSVAHLEAGRYYNFSEHPTDPAIHFPPETYDRLQRIKAEVDPGNLIRANHSVPTPPQVLRS